jgi:hypothetical protein
VTTADVVSGLKVSVVGSHGTTDFVVPWTADVGSVATAYAATHGLDVVPRLALSSGMSLDPDAGLEQAGVATGALLIAARESDGPGPTALPRVPRRGSVPMADRAVPLLAALSAVLAASAAGLGADGLLRDLTAVVLAIGAVVALLPVVPAAWPPVAPLFAGSAIFAITYADRPGGLLVAIAGAAVGAAVVAVVGRALGRTTPEHERVWLGVTATVAIAAASFLLVGAPAAALAPALFGVALVVARVVPSLAIDVPDQVLLDLDKLAVTAWSARERPRGRRGRIVVAPETTATLLRSGQRTVYATTVALSLVVLASIPAMVLAFGGVQRQGCLALLVLGGGALVFMARAHRAVLPRRSMRFAGSVAIASAGVALVLEAPDAWGSAPAFGAVALGGLIVVSAIAVGAGWRSVWWSRVGEIGEGLSLALALAVLPVATGLFDAVRGMTS